MLTVKQVAERLGVSESLVYEWIGGGSLPCYRLGKAGRRGTIRVAEPDLAAFLVVRRNEERPAAPPTPATPIPSARRPSGFVFLPPKPA